MKILNRIKICSRVGMHAWYDTDLGFAIRKPIGSIERPRNEIEYIPLLQLEIDAWGFKTPFRWLNRFLNWLWLRFR